MTDLEAHGHLVRVDAEIDPHLEAAELQRRVYQAGGPALYLPRVKGSAFPMVCNLFGTMERARFIFRDALQAVQRLVALKVDPGAALRRPWHYLGVPLTALHMLPRRRRGGPVMAHATRIGELPQLQCWPDDGGAFITLPQVYTEDPDRPGPMQSNLGMYRIQLSGGEYEPDREVGMHYQIHRGIGVHHAAAVRRGERLPVSIFVGGPPAMTLAAVMPLPEGLTELAFAGALSKRAVRLIRDDAGRAVHADADFCITGTVEPGRTLPEGPFGDHLGYYSLQHDFPVLRVEHVYHRKDAIWPFTSVGRPPQEDTVFGELIHELTGPVIPTVLPGVDAVHAVDAAGVHPLLLAIGSERYTPFEERRRPQELLTQANAILGQGQMSLAKYLWMTAREDAPSLDIHDIPAFFGHVLERFDPRRDLHFQTQTTIDTLDYTGGALNEGSKVVVAAVGEPQRPLPDRLPPAFSLPTPATQPTLCMPGVLAITFPPYSRDPDAIPTFCGTLDRHHPINAFPLVVAVDDSEFTARTLHNFLWVTFTRSNPAADIQGIESFIHQKHWGCEGSLVIDARTKPHHPPPLVEDPSVARRIESLATKGGPLDGIL